MRKGNFLFENDELTPPYLYLPSRKSVVGGSDLSGKHHRIIIQERISRPRGIAVHPRAR
jgi:hypothetical protein